MRIFSGLLFLAIVGVAIGLYVNSKRHSAIPQDGFVPDDKTAIQIAEAVWTPIYGKQTIEAEKPFEAHLINGAWVVTGVKTKDFYGGEALAEISKEDGRIIRVSHGK